MDSLDSIEVHMEMFILFMEVLLGHFIKPSEPVPKEIEMLEIVKPETRPSQVGETEYVLI